MREVTQRKDFTATPERRVLKKRAKVLRSAFSNALKPPWRVSQAYSVKNFFEVRAFKSN